MQTEDWCFDLGDDWNNFSFLFPKKIYGGVLCGSFSPTPSDGVFVVYAEGRGLCSQTTRASTECHPELVSGSAERDASKVKDSELNSE